MRVVRIATGNARLAAMLGIALMASIVAATPASADVFRVDSTADKHDVAIDGACEAANGHCTLRAALEETNHLINPGEDEIRLRAETYKLKHHEGDLFDSLFVSDETHITGRGPGQTTIRQTAPGQEVINLPPASLGDIVTISGLRITGGEQGGVIHNGFALALVDVVVSGNEMAPAAVSARGGGVFSTGSLAILGSRITNNRAHAIGEGASASGGGLYHDGEESGATLEIIRTRIANNRSTFGGASDNAGGGGLRTSGIAVISRSTIAGNRTEGAGGGLFHTGAEALEIERSTLSANLAQTGGGITSFGPLTLENSTVSSNRVEGPPNTGMTLFTFGGGIVRSAGTIALEHSTIARNLVPTDPPGAASGIQSMPAAGSVTLEATILDNRGEDCVGTASITTLGYNLDTGSSCELDGSGDQAHADARLGPLADNGGPTLTHALLRGSDARNAVTAGCPPPNVDQRGVERPHGSACDSGAFER